MRRLNAALAIGLVLAIAAVLVGPTGSTTLSPLVLLPSFALPSFLLILGGAVAGGALVFAFRPGPAEAADRRSLAGVAIVTLVVLMFGLLMIMAATAKTSPLPPVRAGLIFLCGTLALLAGLRTIRLLGSGESIQFETNWGGIGGGMGGWRLSPAAAFAFLAIVFASATVAVALAVSAPPAAKAPEPGAAPPAKAAPGAPKAGSGPAGATSNGTGNASVTGNAQ